MLDELRLLVDHESPTGDPTAIDALARHLSSRLEERGFEIEILTGGYQADYVRAERGTGQAQVLILSHMDTVWPVGTVAERPFRIEGDRAIGPGTSDMKGGIVVALAAIDLISKLGMDLEHRIVWLLTSDEEVGSPVSRPTIEAEAIRSGRVLVTEPGDHGGGAVKTQRKGTGAFDLFVTGVASHAGAAHSDGASAISELARQIARIDALTDYDSGVTTNVGVIGGGQARNVVAQEAWATIDLRIENGEAAETLEARLLNLQPVDPRTSLRVAGGITRPPMARTSSVARTYQLARSLAAELGFDLPEVASGGGSDANFTAALGIPTLDGLGAVGGGMHSSHEFVSISELANRAALMASLVAAPLDEAV